MKRLALILGLALLTVGCGQEAADGDGPTVVAALYPLEWLAEEVGGGLVEVVALAPPGVEPHDLELTPRQVGVVSSADLVLYVGGGFQPALEEVIEPDGALDALDLADPSATDPHVWLDPMAMAALAELLAGRLAEIQPDSEAELRDRGDAVAESLTELDRLYGSKLQDCRTRTFVVAHAAFSYLAQRYDLEQIGIAGADPESEPSPQRIAEVADLARDKEVSTIFYERLIAPDLAETVADEIGATVAELDPLESTPPEGDYVTAMESNLSALTKALDCE